MTYNRTDSINVCSFNTHFKNRGFYTKNQASSCTSDGSGDACGFIIMVVMVVVMLVMVVVMRVMVVVMLVVLSSWL